LEPTPGDASPTTSTVPIHVTFHVTIINETTKGTAEGYTAAKKIYTEGANSKKSDGTLRNIKGWTIKNGEPLGKLYKAYGWDPHGLLQAALAGTDDPVYGNFSTGDIAKQVCPLVALVSFVILLLAG